MNGALIRVHVSAELTKSNHSTVLVFRLFDLSDAKWRCVIDADWSIYLIVFFTVNLSRIDADGLPGYCMDLWLHYILAE